MQSSGTKLHMDLTTPVILHLTGSLEFLNSQLTDFFIFKGACMTKTVQGKTGGQMRLDKNMTKRRNASLTNTTASTCSDCPTLQIVQGFK